MRGRAEGIGIEEENEITLSLQNPENFDKFILCFREPTTGPLFIEAIEDVA